MRSIMSPRPCSPFGLRAGFPPKSPAPPAQGGRREENRHGRQERQAVAFVVPHSSFVVPFAVRSSPFREFPVSPRWSGPFQKVEICGHKRATRKLASENEGRRPCSAWPLPMWQLFLKVLWPQTGHKIAFLEKTRARPPARAERGKRLTRGHQLGHDRYRVTAFSCDTRS